MNSEADDKLENSKARSLAKSLGALFALGSGLLVGSGPNVDAATSNSVPSPQAGVAHLEVRVQKLQEQLGKSPGTEVGSGNVSSDEVQPMWWGNWHNWHPGWGWHNAWRPGWGNGGWGNGGWHNWHNWHNWGNS